MRVLILFALVCAFQVASAAPADEVDCTKIEEVFEDRGLASGVSFVSEKYAPVSTKELLDKRCPEMNESLKTLKRYNQKCHSGLTQQVFSAVFRTRQDFNDKICKDSSSEYTTKRLDQIKCITDNAQVKDRVKAAEERAVLISQVLSEITYKDEKERVTRTCCATVQQKQEVLAATKPQCESSSPLLNEYIDSYLGEAISLVCPDLDKLMKDGECAKLAPLPLDASKSKYSFMMAPMIKVIKSLEH